MSVQAITWALGVECTSATEKAVLLVLANYADERGKCWPSQRTVAKQACTSERTVRRMVADLEARGLLTRENRRRADGSRSTDIIVLAMFQQADNVSTQPANLSGGGDSVSGLPDSLSGHEPSDNHQGRVRRADAQPRTPEKFEQAWSAWPKGQGRNCGKPEACRAWIGQMKAGADEGQMLAAVTRYTKSAEPEYALRFDKFMRDEVWREHAPPGPADERTAWAERIATWAADGTWLRAWGAEPGKPGCKAPPDLVKPAAAVDWQARVQAFFASRSWSPAWGPEPGMAGCKAPPDLVKAAQERAA